MPPRDEPLTHNPTVHDAAGRLGYTSMRCAHGYDGCDDTGCCCTCHDKRDRDAVRAAFRRGLTDVTPRAAGGDVTTRGEETDR